MRLSRKQRRALAADEPPAPPQMAGVLEATVGAGRGLVSQTALGWSLHSHQGRLAVVTQQFHFALMRNPQALMHFAEHGLEVSEEGDALHWRPARAVANMEQVYSDIADAEVACWRDPALRPLFDEYGLVPQDCLNDWLKEQRKNAP